VRNIADLAARIKPSARYAYLDNVTVWLKEPLSRREIRELAEHCGPGGLHVQTGTLLFNPHLRQRLQLRQPSSLALQSLTEHKVHLNRVEIALDWVMNSEEECKGAWDFLARYHVKSHHYDQGIQMVGENGVYTRYSGPRTARNVFALYADRACKLTGELNTVHLEWRIRSPDALKRAGIKGVRDLLHLDPFLFWQRRLICKDWGRGTLGHLYRRFYDGVKKRHQMIERGKFQYDVDRHQGCAIVHHMRSTQQIIDVYQRKFECRRYLTDINVEHLLPVRWDTIGQGVSAMTNSDASRCKHRVLPVYCRNGDINHRQIPQY
jgi:hypothetical protein